MNKVTSFKPDAPMLDSEIVVDGWAYYTEDLTDEDTGRNLRHFVVHEDSGETYEINFSPYAYMMPADIRHMIEMGWPPYNRVVGYPGANWTSRDIELAWFRFERGQPPFIQPVNRGSYWWLAAMMLLTLIITQIFIV
jgi:hypothetical protein